MIKSIEINGFRLLDDFEADLGQLTVVIGANATGKSTLIDCVEFISHAVRYALRDVVSWKGGLTLLLNAFRQADEIRWKVTFRKPEQHPYWETVPFKGDRYYVYEVRIGKGRYDEPIPLYEVLRTEKPYADHSEPLKLLEATRYRSHIFSPSEHMLVPFDEAIPEDSKVLFPDLLESTEKPSENQLGAPEEVAEQEGSLRLARMQFYNEYPIPSWARALLGNCYCYPGFEIGRGSKLRTQPAEIRPHTYLFATGENLGTVLHEVLTRAAYRQAADDIREFLRAAYPSFKDIFAETAWATPAKAVVRVHEKGMRREMELWDLSDGMLRFLCLGAVLLNPIPPALIAIDEPEVGLHPRLLPIVADMIKTAGERTQVLITTHSPDLLNCFDIDSVAVMARDKNEIHWQRPGDRKSLRKMLESVVGDSLGDLHRSGELEAL